MAAKTVLVRGNFAEQHHGHPQAAATDAGLDVPGTLLQVNQRVLRGRSCATARDHIRAWTDPRGYFSVQFLETV
ncbi:MAG: hypothetical protein ACRES6_03180 [Steroidobacteraceae bacterium]